MAQIVPILLNLRVPVITIMIRLTIEKTELQTIESIQVINYAPLFLPQPRTDIIIKIIPVISASMTMQLIRKMKYHWEPALRQFQLSSQFLMYSVISKPAAGGSANCSLCA